MNLELENKSTVDLIQMALIAADEDIAGEYVGTLQYRGTLEVFNEARKLCQSKNIQDKNIGIWILGQLGIPKRTFPEECCDVLLQLWQTESNPDVLCSIGIALGHLGNSRAIAPLVEYKNHPHPDVRYGVVLGILGQEENMAIETLVELSTDIDEDVRN